MRSLYPVLVIVAGAAIQPLLHLCLAPLPRFLEDGGVIAGLYALVFVIPAFWMWRWKCGAPAAKKLQCRRAFFTTVTLVAMAGAVAAIAQFDADYLRHYDFQFGIFAIVIYVPVGLVLGLLGSALGYWWPN